MASQGESSRTGRLTAVVQTKRRRLYMTMPSGSSKRSICPKLQSRRGRRLSASSTCLSSKASFLLEWARYPSYHHSSNVNRASLPSSVLMQSNVLHLRVTPRCVFEPGRRCEGWSDPGFFAHCLTQVNIPLKPPFGVGMTSPGWLLPFAFVYL